MGTIFAHEGKDTDYLCLRSTKRDMHYLRKPYGLNSGLAWGNLGYQMQYSIEELERRLADSRAWHVLQINLTSYQGDVKNPDSWILYADGHEVASGDGAFALQCFEESATKFLETCRKAIEAAELHELTEDEYRLLCRARAIAAVEPFNGGSHILGDKGCRVY